MSRSRVKTPLKLSTAPMARTRASVVKRIKDDIDTLIIQNMQAFDKRERMEALRSIADLCNNQAEHDAVALADEAEETQQ